MTHRDLPRAQVSPTDGKSPEISSSRVEGGLRYSRSGSGGRPEGSGADPRTVLRGTKLSHQEQGHAVVKNRVNTKSLRILRREGSLRNQPSLKT